MNSQAMTALNDLYSQAMSLLVYLTQSLKAPFQSVPHKCANSN